MFNKLKYWIRKLALQGGNVYCCVCEKSYLTFLPSGDDPKAHARCPGCHSIDRHRQLFTLIKPTIASNTGNLNILHVAPEPALSKRYQLEQNIHYFAIDKFEKGYTYPKNVMPMDLTHLTFDSNFFDIVICSHVLEHIENDQLAIENFYASLGMNNTVYNPLLRFPKERIVPTEIDTYFRHDTLQGYVHDMEAAMEGGVGGHAGIFSNAMDLAKMMQLYLQKGTYGNQTYFSEATFTDFNTCWYCTEGNRRGLGFDKPQLSKEGPTCGCVSMSSFGHTGFTGTMAWADPATDIVYIFLSNRTYPGTSLTNKLSKENIREDIQKVIQEAIISK